LLWGRNFLNVAGTTTIVSMALTAGNKVLPRVSDAVDRALMGLLPRGQGQHGASTIRLRRIEGLAAKTMFSSGSAGGPRSLHPRANFSV